MPHIVPKYLENLKQVASDLADMPYDELALFFGHLEKKLSDDSKNDKKQGNYKVSLYLETSSQKSKEMKEILERLWKICEPHMK